MTPPPNAKPDSYSVDRALDRAARLYGQFAELRAATKSIPVVGRALDTLLGERVDVLKGERFLKWIGLLRDLLKEIDEQKVDHVFLESDEFLALFMRTAKEASDCWQEEKIRLFALFLKHSAIKGHYPGFKERTLAVIASLCMGHVEILRYIDERTAPLTPDGAAHALMPSGMSFEAVALPIEPLLHRIAADEQVAFFVDLEAKGLIGRYGGVPTNFAVLLAGRQLLEFISDRSAA